MKIIQLIMMFIISLILSCVQAGHSFQHLNHKVHSGALLNKVPEQVFVGIPLIFQQRRDIALELGINPYNFMGNRNDKMYRDHHPLEDETSHRLETGFKPFRPSHRIMKRGIIWNKMKKIKKGISSAGKKIWKVKNKAVSVIKGPKSTKRPSYASTGGSWSYTARRPSKANSYSSTRPRTNGRGPSKRLPYGVSMPVGWSSAADSGGYRSTRSRYRSRRFHDSQNKYKGLAVRSKIPVQS